MKYVSGNQSLIIAAKVFYLFLQKTDSVTLSTPGILKKSKNTFTYQFIVISYFFYRDNDDSTPFEMQYIKETDLKWSLGFSVKNTDIKIPVIVFLLISLIREFKP